MILPQIYSGNSLLNFIRVARDLQTILGSLVFFSDSVYTLVKLGTFTNDHYGIIAQKDKPGFDVNVCTYDDVYVLFSWVPKLITVHVTGNN